MYNLCKSLLLSGIVACGLTMLCPSAEAVDVELNNQIGKPLSAAVIFFDENINAWKCKGWFTVQPNSFRRLTFSRHNKSNIWVHLHNRDRSWGGSKAWTVRNEAFDYVISQGCPSGTNRRQVTFNRYEIGQSGTVRINAR